MATALICWTPRVAYFSCYCGLCLCGSPPNNCQDVHDYIWSLKVAKPVCHDVAIAYEAGSGDGLLELKFELYCLNQKKLHFKHVLTRCMIGIAGISSSNCTCSVYGTATKTPSGLIHSWRYPLTEPDSAGHSWQILLLWSFQCVLGCYNLRHNIFISRGYKDTCHHHVFCKWVGRPFWQ